MHIAIIDHSVIAYQSFMRIFSQDYDGETQDEKHEFVRQYVANIVFLNELIKPDGMLFVLDCPRDKVWRHRIIHRYYGERLHAFAVEWAPVFEGERTPENAIRWKVECDGQYREVWRDADGREHTETVYARVKAK